MKGKLPKIMRDENARGKPIIITEELLACLRLNADESITSIAKELNIKRDTVRKIYDEHIGKAPHKPTKAEKEEQRIDKRFKTSVKNAEKKNQQKIIDEHAREVVKQRRTLLDRSRESLRDKQGNPLNLYGEELDAFGYADTALIQQLKDSPILLKFFYAQTMRLEQLEKKEQDVPKRKKWLYTVQSTATRKMNNLRQAMIDKGVWNDALQGILDSWADAYFGRKVAKRNWMEAGAYTSDRQITAEGQQTDRPDMLFEAYCKSQAVFAAIDQKLRTSCKDFYHLVNGDDDSSSELDKLWAAAAKDNDED